MPTDQEFIIAIDFGTTFSGVAFIHNNGHLGDDIEDIAGRIKVIKSWPANGANDKTQTVLYYGKKTLWGRLVLPHHEPQITRFKLGLEEGLAQFYQPSESVAHTTSRLLIFKKPRQSQKEPVDFVADYLTCLYNYIHESFFPHEFGTSLQNQSLSYVVTVPAIWSDHAKYLTRVAASRAGIPQDRLTLITEPEAAAVYCGATCPFELLKGDRFLICDAGGGTVVSPLSDPIISAYPKFTIEECNRGTGGPWGALRLDEEFKTLLQMKLDKHAAALLTPNRLSELLRNFESHLKSRFNRFEQTKENQHPIPFPGASDIPSIGLKGEYLYFTRDEIDGIFVHVFEEILKLIREQLEAVKSSAGNTKALFLVGGLGSNVYLRDFLKRKLKTLDIMIIQPTEGRSAIMRGAVLHKLNLNIVKRRLMRFSYGWSSEPLFDKNIHPQSKKRVCLITGEVRCKDMVQWCAIKGEKIEDTNVITHEFLARFKTKDYLKRNSLLKSCELLICKDDHPPQFATKSVKTLCTLCVDVRALPAEAFQLRNGRKGQYYEVVYNLALRFGPELTFAFRYGDRVVGTVSAQYV